MYLLIIDHQERLLGMERGEKGLFRYSTVRMVGMLKNQDSFLAKMDGKRMRDICYLMVSPPVCHFPKREKAKQTELMEAYDERYLMPDGTPSTAKDAGSELWVIDAKTMRRGQEAVTCRIKLPQRVPYGYVPLLPFQCCSMSRLLCYFSVALVPSHAC